MTSRKASARKPSALPTLKDTQTIQSLRQNEVAMKVQIRSLQLEVETLRYRLDSLRKAKNTTVIRREREERKTTPELIACLQPKPPPLQPQQTEKVPSEIISVSSQLMTQQATHEEKMDELRQKYEQKLVTLQVSHDKIVATKSAQFETIQKKMSELQEENSQLVEKLEDIVRTNKDLREANLLLQERCESLLEDLSIKEAQWSEREERLTAEIRKQWGERYHEWIVKAEKKMEELQKINTILQSMLKTKSNLDSSPL